SESVEQGGRAVERSALQESHAAAVSAAKEQQAKEKQKQALIKNRKDMLRRASEISDERFALRKRVAERLTQQFTSIRVTVTQAAELQQYRDLVANALKGVSVKQGPVADRLSQVFLPTELAQTVEETDYKTVMQRAI